VPPLVPMADGRVVACHVRAPAMNITAATPVAPNPTAATM
ncbi:MAG: oligopeptide ABC transporter ATP-binding protein, partial [Mesorhizobium sp.]